MVTLKELLSNEELNKQHDNIVLITNDFTKEGSTSQTQIIGEFYPALLIRNVAEVLNSTLLNNKFDTDNDKNAYIDVLKKIIEIIDEAKEGETSNAN